MTIKLPAWNRADQIELNAFLNTPTGQKLVYQELPNSRPALFDPAKPRESDLAIQVGAYCAGVEAAVEKIKTLSQPKKASSADDDHVDV
jgi:hypothetical protein